MTTTPVPTVTDDVLAEIEAECRDNELREDGQVDGRGACSNAETLSMIRRLRESELRLLSLCRAHRLGDTARMEREVSDALDYILETLRT